VCRRAASLPAAAPILALICRAFSAADAAIAACLAAAAAAAAFFSASAAAAAARALIRAKEGQVSGLTRECLQGGSAIRRSCSLNLHVVYFVAAAASYIFNAKWGLSRGGMLQLSMPHRNKRRRTAMSRNLQRSNRQHWHCCTPRQQISEQNGCDPRQCFFNPFSVLRTMPRPVSQAPRRLKSREVRRLEFRRTEKWYKQETLNPTKEAQHTSSCQETGAFVFLFQLEKTL
jgi:hypothetical protein